MIKQLVEINFTFKMSKSLHLNTRFAVRFVTLEQLLFM